jgi:hypothetical protein
LNTIEIAAPERVALPSRSASRDLDTLHALPQSALLSQPPLTENALIELEPARGVWARVQIAAGRGDVGVAERCLHLGKGSAAVERMRPVGMAQPMRRDAIGDPRTLSGAFDQFFLAYERAAEASRLRALPPEEFVAPFKRLCNEVGIRTTKRNGKLFMVNVKLSESHYRMAEVR